MKISQAMVSLMLVVSIFLCNGCCSLFSEGSQVITVDSDPQGASVRIGEAVGTTPFTLTVPKGEEYVITAAYGGQTQSQTLTRTIDGLYWVNILVWPGLIVDAVTGKMHVYDPTSYSFDFRHN